MILEAQKGNADVVQHETEEFANQFVLASGLTEQPPAASETPQVQGLLAHQNFLSNNFFKEKALPKHMLSPNGVAQTGAGTQKGMWSIVEI